MTSLSSRRRDHGLFAACERLEQGRLRLVTPEGQVHHFGATGPEAELRLHDWAAVAAWRARGGVGLGESYVAGLWDAPSVEAVAALALRDETAFARFARPDPWNALVLRLAARIRERNGLRGAARNVRAHYDVGNEFFGEWLDPSFTYSGALFGGAPGDLEAAQMRKYDRILDRLGGAERVLELGCGWGGFAERAAGRGHEVTAITVSPSQKAFADARLDGRAEIQLRDYRATAGRYDAVVSIEMIEAVGERWRQVYFAVLKARLAEGGRAMLQAITVPDTGFARYRAGTDYIRHATLPGGTLPCAAGIAADAAKAGLRVEESFAFGPDYALTCRAWAERLMARRRRLEALGHGGPVLRHWRYYLETAAACFATGRTDVVQVELAHA